MNAARLELTRSRILAFRRRVGFLDARLPQGPASLRQAAWAGLQDSMPRAAVLSLHARAEGTGPSAWEDPSLVQLWTLRFSVFVVARADHGIFSLGLLPDDAKGRLRAESIATDLERALAGREMPYAEAARALGVHHNRLRYAAATGKVLLRWDGARQPTVRAVAPPEVDPHEARLELARRYLHVYGPTTPEAFATWSGVGVRQGKAAFDALAGELIHVATPIGEASMLGCDEEEVRRPQGPQAPVRLLPSGDPYILLHGKDRELMVPDGARRNALWTPRVWPGGLLLGGELEGTWRRSGRDLAVACWRRLSSSEKALVETEARTLPLIPADGRTSVSFEDGAAS